MHAVPEPTSPNTNPACITTSVRKKPGRAWRFEHELARVLPADVVVAHMIPVYVLLAAPLVRPRRIPLLLWYTHWKASAILRAATNEKDPSPALVLEQARDLALHGKPQDGLALMQRHVAAATQPSQLAWKLALAEYRSA